ncbi:carbohydrate binding domain-containing protein [Paenibacillus nasutitermitis]|uniref:CBM-cenC domain-containing protein n=1 Tax=Paenibacillus nasutitermitis TaxID=1652958 RepID=A0A917E220_9BACL|nr:carbohydrate binding domain-containing protein [Paenibacillus nasutitermitis]GGD94780.1 hypothetical protein GCM10010911_61840 [Paenibacillus nasutitermitis]
MRFYRHRHSLLILLMFVLFVSVSSVSVSNVFAVAPAPTPFPIGILAPPNAYESTQEKYEELADMNVNLIVGGHENVTKSTNETAIRLANANGIQTLVDDWGFHWVTERIQQMTGGGGWFVEIGTNDIGQTFTTPATGSNWVLGRITLKTDKQKWRAGVKLWLNVYDSPSKTTLIGSDALTLPVDTYTPEFVINRSVETNTSYYMELTTNSETKIGAFETSVTNGYNGGQAYKNGVAQNVDLNFEAMFLQFVDSFANGRPSDTYLDDIANHYRDVPGVLGYNLRDEPGSSQFASVQEAVDRLKVNDPDHMALVNLYPNYASPSQLGTDQVDGEFVTSAQSLGQTFRTGADISRIATIQLWLESANVGPGETLTLTLWNSTAKTSEIAHATITSPTTNWPQFMLNADVTPNTNYYWELTHNGGGNNSVGWVDRSVTGVNWINNGTAYKAGTVLNADYWFTINQNITGGTYEDYVYRWVRNSPDVLMFDYYPYGTVTDAYYDNLEVIRRQAHLGNIDFWSYIQSYSTPTPTKEQMGFQIYTNLAYGAKGYVYFTYNTPQGLDNGLILPEGEKNTSYFAAKDLNAEVLKLGPTLTTLSSQAVYHTGTVPATSVSLPSSFFWQLADTSQPALIGYFTNSSGKKYVMVVNKDTTNTRTFTFNLSPKPTTVTEISKTTGAEIVTSYSSTTGSLSASFAPGEGRLYALPSTYEGTNLLSNADFETMSPGLSYPDGWNGGYTGNWNDQFSQSGSHSLRLNPISTNWNRLISTINIPMDPAKHYRVRAWVKSLSSTGTSNMFIREVFTNSTDHYVKKAIPLQPGWNQVEMDYTPGTLVDFVWIGIEADNQINGPIWVDDLYFQEIP